MDDENTRIPLSIASRSLAEAFWYLDIELKYDEKRETAKIDHSSSYGTMCLVHMRRASYSEFKVREAHVLCTHAYYGV